MYGGYNGYYYGSPFYYGGSFGFYRAGAIWTTHGTTGLAFSLPVRIVTA
jgi:hypothetical protein